MVKYTRVFPCLLYGCEAWSLREDLFKRLRRFHNRCARSMCRVDLHHAFRHHITSASHLRRLGILGIGSYFHNRVLRWAGHVARMPTWAWRHGIYWLVGYRILDRLVVHRWLGAGRWRRRSKVRAFRRDVETVGSLHSQTPWCLMAEGHLESKWLQLHYAKGHSAQTNLFWRSNFSVAICYSGVSLYFWGVLTRLVD